MPTYEYACKDCGEHLEVVQSFKDDALTECPSCSGNLRKVFSAAGIIFKGSGWHVKDYAPSNRSGGREGGSSGDGDGGDSKDSAGSKDKASADTGASSKATEGAGKGDGAKSSESSGAGGKKDGTGKRSSSSGSSGPSAEKKSA